MRDYGFTPGDTAALERALHALSSPSLAIRLASAVGLPIERMVSRLPARLSEAVTSAASKAIERALETAVTSLEGWQAGGKSASIHKFACGASGAIGGFFGVPALVLELPVSTTVMLRSIADIARSEGEDIQSVDARLACMEVFALGGRTSADNSADAAYYAVRGALAAAVREASQFIASRGLGAGGAPAIARLVSQIAPRFGASVSQKVAAQAVPVIGAVGGAAINVVFIDHFQTMARAHFTVRRLERKYGAEPIRAALEDMVRAASL
jgi:hypothetical protein